MNPARQWYENWSTNADTHYALNLFKEIGGTDQHIAITQERIAQACFNAAHYKPELDPGHIYRNKIKTEKKQIKQLANAAYSLALSAKRNDKALSWAMDIAESHSGVRVTRANKPVPHEPMAHNLVAEKYFSSLAEALVGRLPELHGGPFLHRFTVGNLSFDKPIAAGRPVTTTTMLAFELAFYLRMHTAGYAGDSPQNGAPMPDYQSNPCYSIVAAFCSAVFAHELVGVKQIGHNVRKLEDVGLVDWPKGY